VKGSPHVFHLGASVRPAAKWILSPFTLTWRCTIVPPNAPPVAPPAVAPAGHVSWQERPVQLNLQNGPITSFDEEWQQQNSLHMQALPCLVAWIPSSLQLQHIPASAPAQLQCSQPADVVLDLSRIPIVTSDGSSISSWDQLIDPAEP
jgi:hypothetical protein